MCDAYAMESQKRAARAWDEGRFARAIVPVKDVNGLTILDRDEHMRPDTNMQSLAALKPSFAMMGEKGGFDAVAIQAHPEIEALEHVHHAGNSSGIVDGAAAVLVGNAQAGEDAGAKPRARIRAFANIGSDPALMLTGPSRRDAQGSGARRHDARRHRPLRGQRSLRRRGAALHAGVRPRRRQGQFDGGAIAIGHPLGATGAMLVGTALDELERTGKGVALVTLCIGAGMGTATIIERV